MKPLSLNHPHLIIMIGIPGSGKSFFAEHFADTFKAPIISYDKIRKNLHRHISDEKSQKQIANDFAEYMLVEVLKTNQTVLLDGQISTKSNYESVSKKARELGYEPLFIWVQTDVETSKKRIMKSGSDKSALTLEDFNKLVKSFSPPERVKNIVVISGKHTYSSQLKIVLKYLAGPTK